MIASETDLFACGYKVHIPSLQSLPTSSKDDRSAPATQARSPVASTSAHRPKNSSQLNSQVKDLGKSLAFSDDVVSTRSPHSVSYSKAKGGLKALYQPNDLGIGSHMKTTSNTVGRHDCRGEPKKHLPCHLHNPTDTKPEYPQRNKRNTKSLTQQNDLDFHQLPKHTRGITTKPGLCMVPSEKSVLWEDEILGKVSSSTARQLTGQISHLTLDGKENPNHSHPSSFVPNQSTGIFSDIFREDDVERNTQLSTPPQPDYLSECRDGARPVHQRKGGNTIVLDNGALFDKVLQETYPLSPSKWCEAESNEVTPKVASVKGYIKWLDLPQPTQVLRK